MTVFCYFGKTKFQKMSKRTPLKKGVVNLLMLGHFMIGLIQFTLL